MKSWITFFLLFNLLFLCGYGHGGGKSTIKVGLFRFSRAVFDQETKKMGAQYQNIEQILASRFRIDRGDIFHEEISYAEMEGPENIFDSSMTDHTNERLEVYCRANRLDGIIFGHIEQEMEILIVFRFYYSNELVRKWGIKRKNRIKSFSRRIKPAYLTPARMQRITTELISELKNEIYKRVAKKTPVPVTKAPPIQKKVTKRPIVEKRPEIVKKREPLFIEQPKETPISVAQVYKMIMAHGFYCDPNKKHTEVLIKLVVTDGRLNNCVLNRDHPCPFEFKRTISVPSRSGGITNTVSKQKNVKADIIPLYWAEDKIEKLTYQEAIEKIKELRLERYGGYSDWRIPTIKELFSIVEPDVHHNFIKLDFKTDIRGNYIPSTMNLWTSTPVEAENKKIYINSCNSRTAYFIIKQGVEPGKYRLKFHLSCANDENRLYVLPVSSGVKAGEKTSQRSQVKKPEKSKPTPLPVKKQQDVYIFDKIPAWTSGRTTSEGKKMAEAVRDWLAWRVEDKIRNENKRPLRNVSGHTIPIEIDRLDYIGSIIFNQSSGISDERAAKKIINRFMSPKDIDVLVGVKYNDTYRNSRGRSFEIWPVVIFKESQKILSGKLVLTLDDIETVEGGLYKLDDGAQAKLHQRFNAAFGGIQIKVEEKLQPEPKVEKKVTLEKEMKKEKKHKPPTTPKTPPVKLEPLYAAKLDFINASPYPVAGVKNQKQVRMITKAVGNEIARQLREIQKKWNRKLEINKHGHRIPNTSNIIENLVETVHDEFLPFKNKVRKIIDTKMKPNKVDIIITGQYNFNAKSPYITIRPMVILKSTQKMLIKNLLFRRKELIGPSNRVTMRLRKGAKKIIAEKVKEFLKGLYE